jgi:hypothetical protein
MHASLQLVVHENVVDVLVVEHAHQSVSQRHRLRRRLYPDHKLLPKLAKSLRQRR